MYVCARRVASFKEIDHRDLIESNRIESDRIDSTLEISMETRLSQGRKYLTAKTTAVTSLIVKRSVVSGRWWSVDRWSIAQTLDTKFSFINFYNVCRARQVCTKYICTFDRVLIESATTRLRPDGRWCLASGTYVCFQRRNAATVLLRGEEEEEEEKEEGREKKTGATRRERTTYFVSFRFVSFREIYR